MISVLYVCMALLNRTYPSGPRVLEFCATRGVQSEIYVHDHLRVRSVLTHSCIHVDQSALNSEEFIRIIGRASWDAHVLFASSLAKGDVHVRVGQIVGR
jgi:hypothetical protein